MKEKARPDQPAAPGRFKRGSGRALQLLGALAVIAAALLDPLQAAIAVAGLVGVVLVDAGVHPRLAFAFLGIFRIDRGREDRRPGWRRRRCWGGRGFLLGLFLGFLGRGGGCWGGSSGRRSGRCRSGGVRTTLCLAEVVPLLAGERAGGLGRLIFCAAF